MNALIYIAWSFLGGGVGGDDDLAIGSDIYVDG